MKTEAENGEYRGEARDQVGPLTLRGGRPTAEGDERRGRVPGNEAATGRRDRVRAPLVEAVDAQVGVYGAS